MQAAKLQIQHTELYYQGMIINRVYTSTRSESRLESGSQSICIYGRGGLSPDSNPVCLRVNATNLNPDLDQNASVNGAIEVL